MKPETLNNRRRYGGIWWPHATPHQKRRVYAMIGRFLKARHPEYIEKHDKRPFVSDGNVLFCKHHGIVGHGLSRPLNEGNCPCAKTSAPSKSISRNTIHFAVLMKDGSFISGCTPVNWMRMPTKHCKWYGADILPVTTDPEQVTCQNCINKIGAAIDQMEAGQ